jgi:hypothetical protein
MIDAPERMDMGKSTIVSNNDPSAPKMVRARLNELAILQERAKGKSYARIAADIGVSSASGVRKALYRALEDLKSTREELVTEYAGVQLERMRIALEAIMPRVEEGELEAIDIMLKIEARTAKLLALDAPGVWPEDGSGHSTAPGSINSLHVSFDNLSETQLEALSQIGVVKQIE